MTELPDFRKLWNYQRPAESEERFREILPQAEASDDKNYLLELKTQIGRTLGLQGKFDEAHALLDEIEAELDDTTQVARLRYLLERGRTFNSGGSPETARPLFLEAWDFGRQIESHGLAVDAAHMMAYIAPVEGQREWNEKAMLHAEQTQDPDAMKWLGTLYNNMGWTCHDEGNFERALELHRKGWDWHRERKTGYGERIAKWSVGKQLRMLGRGEEARAIQTELLSEYMADEPGGEGFVHEELAELKHAAGEVEDARPHFAEAYEMLKQYDWVNGDRLERLKTLGAAAG